MSFTTTLEAAWASLKAKVEAVWQGEVVVVETVGTTILTGLETILTALEPTALADVKAILQGIEDAFLKGSTLDMIAEEVKVQASTDLKAILADIKPQVLTTVIGVIIHAL